MVLEGLPTVLMSIALLLALLGAVRRLRLWRTGQAEPVAILPGLAALPRRYLHDLHAVVARDQAMSNTHVATAGGFVASLLLIIAVHLLGFNNTLLIAALFIALAVMLVGAVFVYRRRLSPPTRLSKGPWMRLPKSLLAFSLGFIVLTLPLSGVLPHGSATTIIMLLASCVIVYALAEMLVGMTWGGPMKHAFAGALHLAFHRRPERFNGGRSTGLKSLPLNREITASTTFGVAKPTDFKWNQLLGFDACVQCGRCEAVCPAFAAGQPLNPKKLIQDMVVGMTGGTDANYSGSPYPNIPIGQAQGHPSKIITDGLIKADTLWSCTTCRACVEECPMMIEHVDAIVDMRRFVTMERGDTPNKGAEVLNNLAATDNPNGYAPSQRSYWAADQGLPLMRDVLTADVLFWVSDGAFDMRSQRILRAFVKLLKAANVDVAILGDEELDCGDVARRLGDEAGFQDLAMRNLNILSRYQFNTLVTTDPHAFHCLKNEYSDLGLASLDDVEVLHHSTFLNRLVEAGKLPLAPLTTETLTYHDPCYLGRYNGEYEAPRNVLRSLGANFVEMERSGFRARCCGGGGGAPITDIPGEHRIADMRMADIKTTAATTVVVGCQQCTAMLEGVVEPRAEVKDIAELLAQQLIEDRSTETKTRGGQQA